MEDLEERVKAAGIEVAVRQNFLTDPTNAVRNLKVSTASAQTLDVDMTWYRCPVENDVVPSSIRRHIDAMCLLSSLYHHTELNYKYSIFC